MIIKKIRKGQLQAVIRRRTGNTIVKKGDNKKSNDDRTLHRKRTIKEHEHMMNACNLGRISSLCSTSDIRRVTFLTNPTLHVCQEKEKEDRILTTYKLRLLSEC